MARETGASFELAPDVFEPRAYKDIAEFIGREAPKYGLAVQSCAEEIDLEKYGISHGKCVDAGLLGKISELPFVFKKDPGQRKACGCVISGYRGK